MGFSIEVIFIKTYKPLLLYTIGEYSMNTPQSQIQNQIQNQTTPLIFETWGSYGQYREQIAILKNGMVVKPSTLKLPFRGTKGSQKFGDVEVIIENNSSSKNTHAVVYVPTEAIHAVVDFYKSSGNFRVKTTRGNVVREENTEELFPSADGRFKYVKVFSDIYYIDNDSNMRILIERTLIREKKELIAKPKVSVKLIGDEVYVYGETFYIKEQLKVLGFKWDPVNKTWKSTMPLSLAVELLRDIAEVIE